jgi:hypothetical protein
MRAEDEREYVVILPPRGRRILAFGPVRPGPERGYGIAARLGRCLQCLAVVARRTGPLRGP